MTKRKPKTAGAEALRVVHNGRYEWFYDIWEAIEFVVENWENGKELSIRISPDGKYWEPVYIITEDGTVYASPNYANLDSRRTMEMGNRGNWLYGEGVTPR